MDFITGLPKSKKQNDYIFVVIDKLSKAAHFIPVNIIDILLKDIYMVHNVRDLEIC